MNYENITLLIFGIITKRKTINTEQRVIKEAWT